MGDGRRRDFHRFVVPSDRTDERDALLLPGLRQECGRHWGRQQHGQRDPAHDAGGTQRPRGDSSIAGRGARWSAPATGGSPITDYTIQRSPNGTTGWVTVNDGISTASSYRVTGLTNGTRYYFRVFAKNAVGTGAASNTANAIPRTTPGAPSGLRATPRSRSVGLSWGAPATGGSPITDYIIQRSPNGTNRMGDGQRRDFHRFVVPSDRTDERGNGCRRLPGFPSKNAVGLGLPATRSTRSRARTPGAPSGLRATPRSRSVGLSSAHRQPVGRRSPTT